LPRTFHHPASPLRRAHLQSVKHGLKNPFCTRSFCYYLPRRSRCLLWQLRILAKACRATKPGSRSPRIFLIRGTIEDRSVGVLDETSHERLVVIVRQISFELSDVLGGYAKWALPSAPMLKQSTSMLLNPLPLGLTRLVVRHRTAPPKYASCSTHDSYATSEARKVPLTAPQIRYKDAWSRKPVGASCQRHFWSTARDSCWFVKPELFAAKTVPMTSKTQAKDDLLCIVYKDLA
jgi:hypothetical protein